MFCCKFTKNISLSQINTTKFIFSLAISHKKNQRQIFFHFFKNGMGGFPCFCVIGVKTFKKEQGSKKIKENVYV